MKRTLLLLVAFLVIAVGLFWAYQRPFTEDTMSGAEARNLFTEAIQYPPKTGGSAWPEDDEIAKLTSEWHKLSPADSTLLHGLMLNWIYAESKGPGKLVTAGEIDPGLELSLEDRLRIGELLYKNPEWRVGVMRHLPSLAGVILPLEKRVLHLATHGSKTTADMSRALGIHAEDIQKVVDDWIATGWMLQNELEGGTRYQAADRRIAQGGALEFVGVQYRGHSPMSYISLDAAIKAEGERSSSDWVTFTGVCPQTTRTIKVTLAAGRLRTGRPADAHTAEVKAIGRTSGFFASQAAYEKWSSTHPDILGADKTAVACFREVLASS